MDSAKETVLPKREYSFLILNCVGGLLFVLETDFLQKPFSDTMVLIMLCFWITLFCISIIRISIASEGIKIYLWRIPLRRVSSEKLSHVEIVIWHDVTHVIFEIGNCPKYAGNNSANSLWIYLISNMFRTIEYIPPQNQINKVLEQINTVFEAKMQT